MAAKMQKHTITCQRCGAVEVGPPHRKFYRKCMAAKQYTWNLNAYRKRAALKKLEVTV